MDPMLVSAAGLLTFAAVIVWWTNRPDPERLPDTRERRRMTIEHERHRREGI
jgi:hypothetical protein